VAGRVAGDPHGPAAANYGNGSVFSYTYDAVGNRLTQTTITNTTVYTYDDANRLINVGGVAQTWDNNGNLLSDGVYTYTYDSANHPITIKQGTTLTYTFGYDGLGDRVRQTINGITTTYALNLNAGLTQVLADGTNTYLYGNGRIAQYAGTTPSYFLPDALGSVRQLANASGVVTLAKSYQPYGSVMSSVGTATSTYGFTGEATDNTGLVYLRARYYGPQWGRFITRDTWPGDRRRPMSFNAWLYAYANPVNLIDPSGLFSASIIKNSLRGESEQEVFGEEHYAVARWGLYALLRDAKDFDRITLRYADFSYQGAHYPLAPHSAGSWIVHAECDELILDNQYWGEQSLIDFIHLLDLMAALKSNTEGKWWRPATLEYHWYDRNGQFYSDFTKGTDMPDVIIAGGSIHAGFEIAALTTQDRYGNEYLTIQFGAGGLGLGAEFWEGYASVTSTPRRFGDVPDERTLRNIIEGIDVGVSVSLIGVGIGHQWWNVGGIAVFGDSNPWIGINVGALYTFYNTTHLAKAWDWVDREIPVYGPEVLSSK
jgi:RHS repeat-associated protein